MPVYFLFFSVPARRYNVLQFTIGLARGRRANLYREVARKEVARTEVARTEVSRTEVARTEVDIKGGQDRWLK